MPFTEEVIDRTRHIEKLLSDLGGTGKGLHELASSLGSILHPALLKRLRFIASVRNKLLHAHGYRFDGDQRDFLAACDDAIAQLSSPAAPHRSSPPERRSSGKTRKPRKPGSSNGWFPALVVAAICLIILPFTLTQTVKQGMGIFKNSESVTDWSVVLGLTFLAAVATFFVARRRG